MILKTLQRFRKKSLFLVIMNLGLVASSQNLVPNPSFETYTTCPTSVNQLNSAIPWVTPTLGTPDYFNVCSTNNFVDVPGNFFGFQNARTGDAYAHCVFFPATGANSREYIQAQLTSPLIVGQDYVVSFYVSLANNSKFACNNIGAYLSVTAPFSASSLVLAFTPQINEPSIVTDTVNWILISGVYTATGGEQYITIGNFFDDASTSNSINLSTSFFSTFYLIDDVSVIPVPQPPNILLNTTNDTICEGSCSLLSATVSGGALPNTITWDNGVPNGLGPHNICPSVTTTYTAIVTDSVGLSDTANITLYVIPTNTTSITSNICKGDSLFVGGSWQKTPGIYSDVLVSALGCDSIHNTILNVLPLPLASITGLDSVCEGTLVVLTANGGGTYFWNTNDTTSSININPSNTSTYTVIVSSGSCTNTTSFTLVVNPLPAITANSDVTIAAGTSTTLTTIGSNGTYTWSPQDWLSCITCPITISTPEETITYTISVVDSNGCIASDNITVTVNHESVIFVPNVFTPNGDGDNDIFLVKGFNLKKVEGEIYNRWGQKMFFWDAIRGFWDGRTNSGEEVPDGTYFFIIKAIGSDGKQYLEKGSITLIR